MSCYNVGLILACCAVLAYGVPDMLEPLRTRASSKIVGGTPAADGEFPWQVSIQDLYAGLIWMHKCDGSIISNEFILTYADEYCVNLSTPRIVAGTLNLTTPGSIHNLIEVIKDDRTGSHLALVRVSPPFKFDCNTRPVQLPARFAETTPGNILTVSAWGSLDIFEPSTALFKLQSLIIPKDECSMFDIFQDLIYFICARNVNSEVNIMATHQGYGAPLIHDGELRGVYYTVLDLYKPAIYVEVSLFREWIFRVAGV